MTDKQIPLLEGKRNPRERPLFILFGATITETQIVAGGWYFVKPVRPNSKLRFAYGDRVITARIPELPKVFALEAVTLERVEE